MHFSDVIDIQPVRSRESRSPDLSNALQTADGTDFEMKEFHLLDSDTEGEDEEDDIDDVARRLNRSGPSRGLISPFSDYDSESPGDFVGVRSFNEDGERLKLAQEGPLRGVF